MTALTNLAGDRTVPFPPVLLFLDHPIRIAGLSIKQGASERQQLYGVANYGIGANMDGGKSLAAMTGHPVTRDNHVSLKHLCR